MRGQRYALTANAMLERIETQPTSISGGICEDPAGPWNLIATAADATNRIR
jgi:hypothetical protein